jgi:molybdopterin synthase sulfur carrier subunit
VFTVDISVRLFTTLRELAGKGTETLEFEVGNVSVRDVLAGLAERHGKKFRDYLYDESGAVREHLQLLVNGKSTAFMEELDTRVSDGDEVAIVPPVGGG